MNDGKKSSLAKNPCYHITKDPTRAAQRLKISFRKDKATVVSPAGVVLADCLYTVIDVSEKGTGLFTSKLLGKGDRVVLKLDTPVQLQVIGLVVWSIPVHSGLHSRKFPFRSGLQFLFNNEEEKAQLYKFLEKVSNGDWTPELQAPAIPEIPIISASTEEYGPPLPVGFVPDSGNVPPTIVVAQEENPAPAAEAAIEIEKKVA